MTTRPRIVITGVAGFLGSALARWLLKHEPAYEIVGIDDLSTSCAKNVPSGVSFIEDSVNADSLFFALPAVYVFHFAAFASECLSPFVREYTVTKNTLATTGLINAAIRARVVRVVFTSSAAVYGARERDRYSEQDACEPLDPYGLSKLTSEHDLRIARVQHGLNSCVLRLHNVYGPGQSIVDDTRNVFGIWARARLRNEPMRIYGDGSQRRQFSFVDDVMPIVWRAAHDPRFNGRTINVGSDRETSLLEAADTFRTVTGGGDLEFVPARHESRCVLLDHAAQSALLSEIGASYADRSLLYGLREFWHGLCRADADAPPPDYPVIELEHELPASWRHLLD